MAGKLYFCRHQWSAGTCAKCGMTERDISSGPLGRGRTGGQLPDYLRERRRPPTLEGCRDVSVSTADFDPWAGTVLGPSVVATTAAPVVTTNNAPLTGTKSEEFDAVSEDRMLQLVNAERMNRGLPELVVDEGIRTVARGHSASMRERGFFEHTDPDGLGPADRAKAGGIRFSTYAENIAANSSVEGAHQGLMNSEGHRTNILHPAFRRIGIGVSVGGPWGRYFTQNFAD